MDHNSYREHKGFVPAKPSSDGGKTHKGFVHTKPLYSVPEVMMLLGLGRNSVYNLFNTGRLHPSPIGRRTLVQASEIDRFIDSLSAESSCQKAG